MSEDKRDPVNEQGGDDDLLDGVDNALRSPAEGAKAAGVDVDETEADDQVSLEDNDDEEDDSDSDSDSDEEERESNRKDLKVEIGRQANEIGELRKEILRLQSQLGNKDVEVVDVRAEREKAMRERWGDALVDDMRALMELEITPVKSQLSKTVLKERYPDIDNVKGEMDKIFKASPALQQAAQSDTSVLDTVYAAAKAKIGSTSSGQKEEARKKMVAKQKEDAIVEKPSPKSPPKPKQTEEEWKKGFVDDLINLAPNA